MEWGKTWWNGSLWMGVGSSGLIMVVAATLSKWAIIGIGFEKLDNRMRTFARGVGWFWEIKHVGAKGKSDGGKER